MLSMVSSELQKCMKCVAVLLNRRFSQGVCARRSSSKSYWTLVGVQLVVSTVGIDNHCGDISVVHGDYS